MKVSIIVPTYNESENIEKLINRLLEDVKCEKEIVVVDDNSPDGTGRIVSDIAKKDPEVKLIEREGKLGLGTAYKAGFKEALKNGSDCVVTMDADFSHSPAYINSMVELLHDADLVIGSRYVNGGKIVECTSVRKFISRVANVLAKSVVGLKNNDCTAGFRCYKRSVLEKINLDSIVSDGYSFLIEMLWHCQDGGFVVKELPITFVNRKQGISKISKGEIFKAIKIIFRLGNYRLRKKLWR